MPESHDSCSDAKLEVSTDRWTPRDTGWMLNLFGTAIGAGVLYLPIRAGVGGIWPLIILSLIAGPIVWVAHRNLVRFCLSSTNPMANITITVQEHFGEKYGHVLTWAYCLSIYPILLMYSIGMTNIIIKYIDDQLYWEAPSRIWVSLSLISILIFLMHTSEKWMLVAVKTMVYPLVITLICISVYLIPFWNLSFFSQEISFVDVLLALFFTIPILIFSFNHSPACSAFAQTYRVVMDSLEACEKKTQKILWRNTMLLLVVILFFVFSCVLSLTPEELLQAKVDNLPVLSVLEGPTGSQIFKYLVPLIGLLAFVSSFFGVYLGALEGIQGIVSQQLLKSRLRKPPSTKIIRRSAMLFIVLTCWWAGYMNWSVLGMIEVVVVPILATILYIMPVYAYYRVSKLKQYRSKIVDFLTIAIGLIAISGFLLGELLY